MNDEMILALRALADPSRARIVEFLADVCCHRAEVTDDGGVIGPTAGEVCCHITGQPVINSTISHHLAELEAAGLIDRSRQGKTTICRLRPEKLRAMAEVLVQLSEGGDGKCC
jgi:DNA-binding transcriptional ArsR family regulator